MGANSVNNFPDPLEQLRVIQSWFAYLNAVPAKLARIANQTRSMRKGPHGHWTIIGCHPAEFCLGQQCSFSAEVARAQGSNYPGRAATDNKHVQHIQNLIDPENWIECPWNVERLANSWKYLKPTLILGERLRFDPTPSAFTL